VDALPKFDTTAQVSEEIYCTSASKPNTATTYLKIFFSKDGNGLGKESFLEPTGIIYHI
jgi:hypothetical protein